MRESAFEAAVIKEIRSMFPGVVILKNDAYHMQGIPDRTILWGDMWAMLEFKASAIAPFQPNQEWYIEELGQMSFVAVIYPSNKEEVLRGLQQAFSGSSWASRPARPQ